MSSSSDALSADLNPPQQAAVRHGAGPLLVLAGAGSGKTRVLTARLARLLASGEAEARHVLAMTFTNKAAREMRDRVARLVSPEAAAALTMGTFHSFGARYLRSHADRLGLTRSFTILDADDALRVLTRVVRARAATRAALGGAERPEWTPAAFRHRISEAKNALVGPEAYAGQALTSNDPTTEETAEVYAAYQQGLEESGCVDFDDLLRLPADLLGAHADLRAAAAARWRWVLVDEYQDTNHAQFRLLQHIAGGHRNLMAVGDDDQCLVQGTLVTMGDGQERVIESVRAGEYVRTALGGGRFGRARVLRVHTHPGGRAGVRVVLRSGREIVSTVEHTHFAGTALGHAPSRPRSGNSIRRHIVLTLCGDRPNGRNDRPRHRIALMGNDARGREVLEGAGFSVRAAERDGTCWRFATASSRYQDLLDTVQKLTPLFPEGVQVVQTARLGRPGPGARTTVAREAGSLSFLPAGSVLPGMVMFDAEGGYDVVERVERLTLEVPVYDLDVERTHNYVANGIITHNSIFGWRGAEVKNILDFPRHFPGTTVVRLEQNYRSTGHILGAANAVIRENVDRTGKVLWTAGREGDPVAVQETASDLDESRLVATAIGRVLAMGHSPADVAVLYRTNAQSRLIEQAISARGVPYRVVGGLSFYARREVKDVLAYARLLVNPGDDVAFERVVNVPRRGIGEKGLAALRAWATSAGLPMAQAAAEIAAGDAAGTPAGLGRARTGVVELAGVLEELRAAARTLSVDRLLQHIVTRLDLETVWRAEGAEGVEGEERIENAQSLVAGAAEYVAQAGPHASLGDYLEQAVLATDLEAGEHTPGVTLMTMHAAKGLEFPVVIVTGMEEGLSPHGRSTATPETLEEERRLFYVALTRAERHCLVTYARARRQGGEVVRATPSRFLTELPAEHCRFSRLSPGPAWNAGPARAASAPVARPSVRPGLWEEDEEEAPEMDPDIGLDLPEAAPRAGAGPSSGARPGGVGMGQPARAGQPAQRASAPEGATTTGPRPSAHVGADAGRPASDEIRAGDHIQHPQHGAGVVRASVVAGTTAKLVVEFASGRQVVPLGSVTRAAHALPAAEGTEGAGTPPPARPGTRFA